MKKMKIKTNQKSSSSNSKEQIKDVRAISRFRIPENYSMEDVSKHMRSL